MKRKLLPSYLTMQPLGNRSRPPISMGLIGMNWRCNVFRIPFRIFLISPPERKMSPDGNPPEIRGITVHTKMGGPNAPTLLFYAHLTTPHPIFLPAFPDGWVKKSSAPACTTTVLPIISSTRNLPVRTWLYALPLSLSSGGRSPA